MCREGIDFSSPRKEEARSTQAELVRRAVADLGTICGPWNHLLTLVTFAGLGIIF